MDASRFCDIERDGKNTRQDVDVLMAVHMIWPQTRAKNLLRLRRELVVDVVAADAAEEIVSDKRHVVRTETAVRTDERRNIRWRQHRPSIDEREMDADAKR